MYYSKYFEGSIPAQTSLVGCIHITDEGELGSGLVGENSNRVNIDATNVIGQALASTLQDCGLDAEYDHIVDGSSHSFYLYFDKQNSNFGVYLLFGYYQNIFLGYRTSTSATNIISSNQDNVLPGASPGYYYNRSIVPYAVDSNTNISPFKVSGSASSGKAACNYKFCVTVKGEPTSSLRICIGRYDDPSYESYQLGFSISFGKDVYTDEDIYMFSPSSVNNVSNVTASSELNTYGVILDSDLVPYLYRTTNASVSDTPGSTSLPLMNQVGPSSLIYGENTIQTLCSPFSRAFPTVSINNAYQRLYDLAFDRFYNIDNNVYYTNGSMLVKCTSEVTPTEDTNNG